MSKELSELRRQLDEVDTQLLKDLQKRFDIVDQIGQLKQMLKEDIVDLGEYARRQKVFMDALGHQGSDVYDLLHLLSVKYQTWGRK